MGAPEVLKSNWTKQKLLKRVLEEQKFIGDLFDMVAMPSREDEEDDGDVYVGKPKQSREEARTKQRAKSFQELRERLDRLKGAKDFSIKNKMIKKSLAKRIKKKTRKEERLQKKKAVRMKKETKGSQKREEEPEGLPLPAEESVEESVAKAKRAPPVFNSRGKMVFSKFDFTESGAPPERTKGERDPKKILETLKKHRETVKELREAGETDKAALLTEKSAWKNALAKAEGQKVKDDPILLKKSLKKKEQKKKQSSNKWDERLQKLEKTKENRQKKRETNLNKRKQDKKKKVIKKAVKKGRMMS